jgi:hypothetical protein
MAKNKDEFEDLGVDLDEVGSDDFVDEGEVDEAPPAVAAPVAEKKRAARKAAPVSDEDDFEDERPTPKGGDQAQKKRKNLIAGVLIGVMVVVGSAGFMYLTAPRGASQPAMSPFESMPTAQTALTEQAYAQPQQAMGEVAEPQPMQADNQPMQADNQPVMAETPAAALAGGEISLDHEKIHQATQQAVSSATQDLSTQVMAMGLQIAELQSRLEASANKSVCDTNAIVEELRQKMKDDAAAEKAATAKQPVKAKTQVAKAEPKAAKSTPPKPKATDSWKVLGLSSDRAVVTTSKGDQVVVSVGDVVEGATIKKIDPVQGVVVTSEGTVK